MRLLAALGGVTYLLFTLILILNFCYKKITLPFFFLFRTLTIKEENVFDLFEAVHFLQVCNDTLMDKCLSYMIKRLESTLELDITLLSKVNIVNTHSALFMKNWYKMKCSFFHLFRCGIILKCLVQRNSKRLLWNI